MEFFLIGLVTGLIGSIPFDYGRNGWLTKWIVCTIVLTIMNTFFAWLWMPQLIGPFWGWGICLMVLWGLALNTVWLGIQWDTYQGQVHDYLGKSFLGLGLMCLLFPIGGLRGCVVFRANDYHAFVGDNIEKREWQKDIQPIDTNHIRLVSEKQAEWLSNKAFGQADSSLGSQFKLGQLTIQKVKNELVWIAPLEFQGFTTWSSAEVTPGYVIMSAQDPTREPKLVMGYRFRYVPSAYWGDNLERHLYTHGFMMRGTTDYTFEIDDNEHPFYVVTVYQPSIGYGGEVVEGVAVVNPETGEITQYTAQSAPLWIDRIIPEEFALQRLVDFGMYGNGWMNTWWGRLGINKPTEESLDLVWADDGQAYWSAGITSAAGSDQSLIAYVLMNTRTGETREYALEGSDEDGVVEAVNAAVSNFKGWEATDPILYNIYGELTWAVPVVSGGIFQQLALVQASNVQVTLGKDKNVALAKYRVALQSKGNTDAPTADSAVREIAGKVKRFGCGVVDGNTICSIMLEGDPHVFTASPSLSPKLVLTVVSDPVLLVFVETTEPTVPLQSFDLHALVLP